MVLGASRKHREAIASLEADKPSIDWDSYSKVIKGNSDIVHDLKVTRTACAVVQSEVGFVCHLIRQIA